ncbi:hypothetical protein F4778DRAFT_787831 [Xylariomycetidae sp. FL2044]|nr:hypothetical protein F4778DRAFT_787831 [Xylariomycetidae sp. FL2044]
MAGLLSSWSDETCNHHNALRNVSEYACGVTFTFKSGLAEPPPDMQRYAVVSMEKCCAKANSPVMRIPGNTGCEMQFCEVPSETTTRTFTVEAVYETGSGTAAATPPPYVTQEVESDAQADVVNCMYFVYESDLPDDIADQIESADNWCVVRMYDDEMDEDDVRAAVTAETPAPPSWTESAGEPWEASLEASLASKSAAEAAGMTATPSTGSASASRRGYPTASGIDCGEVRIWAVFALMTLGLAIVL